MSDIFYEVVIRAVTTGVYLERKEAKLRKVLRNVKEDGHYGHEYEPLIHMSRQLATHAGIRYGQMPIIEKKVSRINRLCDMIELEIRKYRTAGCGTEMTSNSLQ